MPKWLDTAVFYEIYPQSFQDTNADGIGDIPGIIRRLDYIRELGCNALWLNPCFESPFNDAGYDVADYKKVAPRYGTNDDLVRLFTEAHKRNMRVILDLVPGHTSSAHPWFRESMKPEPNEYSHRYIWTDSIWKDVENVSSVSGSLRGISSRDGSCALNFFTSQPALNYGFAHPSEPWQLPADSPEALATREAMKDVMRFWLGLGCDGFRVDMAFSLVKNDPEQKKTIELWQDFRHFLDTDYPDAAFLSEWGDPAKALLAGFHMDFLLHVGPSHYPELFRTENPYFSHKGTGDASKFVAYYEQARKTTGGKGLICIPSGNHDMCRIARHLDIQERKRAFAFLLSMPGAPFIYYGDEIGLRHVENLVSVEGGYDRTGARTPMQWDTSPNAGFSTAAPEKLYIRQDSSPDRPVAEKERAKADSLYAEVRRLIALRLEHEPLQNNADIKFLSGHEKGSPLVYLRSGVSGKILCAFNPSPKAATVKTPALSPQATLYHQGDAATLSGGILSLPAGSATFIQVD